MEGSAKVGSIHYDLDLNDSDFQSKSKGVHGQLENLGGAFQNAEAGSRMFAAGLAAVGVAAVSAIGFGVKFAADLETMTQGFVTLLGSSEKADAAINMIKKDAAKTPFELPGLISANQMLTSVTKNADTSERFLLNVGKALTAMGKGQPELDRIIVNLQQIGAVGHASAIDIKQFAFAGIPIFDMLQQATGKTGEALQDMVSNGEVTFQMLMDMFNKAGEGTGRFAKAFELQGGTFNQTMSNFKDNIGIAMGEIVKQTGIFDIVKKALAGLTAFISQNTPAIIEFVKTLFGGIAENAPIIIGLIVGGLMPAFVGLMGTLSALISGPFLAFVAAGTAIGVIVKLLIDAMGGWEATTKKLTEVWNAIGQIFTTFIKPALDQLWAAISENLLPALSELWNLVGPLLGPVLKALAVVLGGAVIIALRIVIEGLILLVNMVSGVINIINTLLNVFRSMDSIIRSAMSGVYNAIVSPFQAAFEWINNAVTNVVNKLKDLSPFTKHSPSLVEQVTKGVDIIKDQYMSLADINIPQPVITPAVAMGGGATNGRSINSNQNITINVDKVNSQQDVKMLGQELGFRASLTPELQNT